MLRPVYLESHKMNVAVAVTTLVVPICVNHDMTFALNKQKKKKTPWPLVRERTIPTDRPPLVDEI
jgi:hypothetical protein